MQGEKNKNKLRIAALIILACLVIGSFSAEIFIISKVKHECETENCPVCETINKVKTLDVLIDELLASVVIVSFLVFYIGTSASAPARNIFPFAKFVTLVDEKIKMNN